MSLSLHPDHHDPSDNDDATIAFFSGIGPGDVIELEVADDEDEAELPSRRGSIAGTIASVIVHVWLLMNLAQMTIEQEPNLYEPPIDAVMDVVDQPEEEIVEVVKYELANPDERDLEVREVLNAASVGIALTTQPKSETAPRPITELIPTMRERSVYDIPEGTQIDQRIVVNGTNGEAMIQLESALDRVTWEIANNLREQRVLVVWLLDASGSLTRQREAIAKRLRRVYGELDALQKNTEQIPKFEIPLLSGVVTFGAKTTFVTQVPTDDFETILSGVQNVQNDESGLENIFTAARQVVTNWSEYRLKQKRRIMLITVTDEAGDDFSEMLEPCIATCNRYGAKAYVIGPAAVFGRRKGYVPYIAPENNKEYRLPIDLGPETAVLEHIDLPFWYSGPQLEYLSSGFAPYALARLVHETGGVYFMSNMTTMSGLSPVGVFDSAALKPFMPDYRFGTAQDYQRDLMANPVRYAVVQAAFLSREYQAKGTPQLDLRVNPGNFRQVASDAQKSVAESQLMIDSILAAIPSDIENKVASEDSLRWRMNFYLTFGRLLGQRVRCLEYNSAMAAMKTSLSNDDVATKSNHWIVRPSQTINYMGSLRKVAEKATGFLEQVIAEAPGTPWAVLAQRELKDGFGIQIEQRFIPPPPPAPPRPPGNPTPKRQVLFAQEPKAAAPPPPPPKPPVLPKL